tara:strand:+ start:535 stop:699 length:165 start_codon:yes stop_codon:yes gene_type:complete
MPRKRLKLPTRPAKEQTRAQRKASQLETNPTRILVTKARRMARRSQQEEQKTEK